jgi:hypothetical protein
MPWKSARTRSLAVALTVASTVAIPAALASRVPAQSPPPATLPSGDPETLTEIAMLRDRPLLGDTSEALQLYLAAARQGYPTAMSRLGIRYEIQNAWLDAAFWFHLAADRSDFYAIHALPSAERHAAAFAHAAPAEAVEIAARHEAIARSIPDAGIPWSVLIVARHAAEQGTPRAQRWLGQMYATGATVTQNDSLAEEWVRLAARNGDPDAQALVASHDRGQRSDWGGESHIATESAAEGYDQAIADAAVWLGHVYLEGRGVPPNDTTAVHWLMVAARRGSPEAQTTLGLIYASGHGVARDDVMAYALLTAGRLAAGLDTRTTRQALATRLTREQLAEARALTASFAGAGYAAH